MPRFYFHIFTERPEAPDENQEGGIWKAESAEDALKALKAHLLEDAIWMAELSQAATPIHICIYDDAAEHVLVETCISVDAKTA